MKNKSFVLLPNSLLYLFLIAGALIFTQALRSPVSGMLFVFVLLFPLFLLLYVLTAKPVLRVFVQSKDTTVRKGDLINFEFKIINDSPVPYPFLETCLSLPDQNSVRCSPYLGKLSLSPFSHYNINNYTTFRFRGTYEIGVTHIYVYDFFRLFKLKINFNIYEAISVLPRRLIYHGIESETSAEDAEDTRKILHGYERADINEIRSYRTGDLIKNIHWKLSSKQQDLVVKDYNTGSTKSMYIFCDLSASFPGKPKQADFESVKRKNAKKKDLKAISCDPGNKMPDNLNHDSENNTDSDDDINKIQMKNRKKAEYFSRSKKRGINKNDLRADDSECGTAPVDLSGSQTADIHELCRYELYEDINEYCADGVIELTIAALTRELRRGNACTLTWHDRRSETGMFSFAMRSPEDFEMIFKLFATAPLGPASDSVTKLTALTGDMQSAKQLFVTSAVDSATLGEFCRMKRAGDAANNGSCELLLFNPANLYEHKSERLEYLELCRRQLAENGIKLTEGILDELR